MSTPPRSIDTFALYLFLFGVIAIWVGVTVVWGVGIGVLVMGACLAIVGALNLGEP